MTGPLDLTQYATPCWVGEHRQGCPMGTEHWPRVIGLSAKKRHGKDTFGAQLQALGYARVAFADALYEEVADAYGVSVARLQDPATKEMPMAALGGASPRACLQNHGMRRRAADPEYWIRRVEAVVQDPTRRFVVTDVRLPDEAAAVARYGVVVRITRPGLPAAPDYHISETALDAYPFRYRLTNHEGDPASLLRNWMAVLDASRQRPLITHLNDSDPGESGTHGSCVDENGAITGWWCTEDVTIPGMPREQIWSLDAHEEVQFHEIQQTAVLTDAHARAAHEVNGPAVLPAKLFVRAVDLARDSRIPYQERFAGAEDHPAIALLCTWWDTARPAGEPYAPGFCMPWVRIRDDGLYWPGYYQIPTEDVDGFNPDGRNMARVGDTILVAFYATQRVAHHKPGEVTIYLPTGEPYATVVADWDDYQSGVIDEAWYGLQALAQFPDRFPAAWEFVTNQDARLKP